MSTSLKAPHSPSRAPRNSASKAAACTGTVSFFLLSALIPALSASQPQDIAPKAQTVLSAKCSACHSAAFLFDPKSRSSLVQKVVKPGSPDSSLLVARIASGQMPPDGSPKLTAAEFQTIKDWIQAGAPDWNASSPTNKIAKAAFLTEGDLLKEILADLQSIDERKRPFVRYFSTANLLRDSHSADTIRNSEAALSKAVNSLSWSPDIVKIRPFGSQNALYRLDIRDVEWTPKTWERILSTYPYGYVPTRERGKVDQIRTLSGAALPYIRADWFIATATIPPLYHDILHLPDHIAGKGGLEELLGVDVAKDQQEDKVIRAGLVNSGVSHNNRAVERHRTNYGYYYKSFDFASNEGRKNIFQFPMDFKEDGGEFIFSLPNGMQGYLIAKSSGERLNVAPTNIVRDRDSTFDEVAVTNGLSCISCHASGMQFFDNQVRQHLDTLRRADFDLDRAKTWYVTTADLLKVQLEDAKRFEDAVVKSGGSMPHFEGKPSLYPKDEPVTQVAQLYKKYPVSEAGAAAECGLPLEEFYTRMAKNSHMAELGLGVLLQPNGSVKRDVWEQDFAKVVDEIGLGEAISPVSRITAEAQIDARTAVRIDAEGKSSLASRLKSQLFLTFGHSDSLKPVTSGGSTVVEVSASEDGSHVSLHASVDGHKFDAEGDLEGFSDLAAKLADDIHLQLTHEFVPIRPNAQTVVQTASPLTQAGKQELGPDASTNVSGTTSELLALALKTGTIGAAISIDRGPGAVYHVGEEIVVRFSVTQDCNAALYDIDSSGQAHLLFPNSLAKDNRLHAGEIYSGDSWMLSPQAPFGRDRIFLLAAGSNDQLPGVNAFIKDPSSDGLISKSVGVFARKVQGNTQGASANSLGASVVEFFTAK